MVLIVAPPPSTTGGGGGTGGGTGDGGGVTVASATAPIVFQVSLTGGDGSYWDLSNGPARLLTGVQAFAAPDVTHFWQTSPVVDGSRWDGMRTGSTDNILPVAITAPDWQTWRDTDAAFFRAIHPGNEVALTVTAPDGTSRTKMMRFVSGGGVEGMDPLTQGFASYLLEFTAANPYWRGDDVSVTYSAADPVPFFPGPPFYINGNATSTATIANPGDEPAWPRYIISGAASSWSVGVGAALVSSNTAVADRQLVVVDTNPDELTVMDGNGNDVYESLANDSFAAIPAGARVPLSLELDTPGVNAEVTVEFTPLYRRPW